jgi:hypothetical protein
MRAISRLPLLLRSRNLTPSLHRNFAKAATVRMSAAAEGEQVPAAEASTLPATESSESSSGAASGPEKEEKDDKKKAEEAKLPPLTPHEFREYNRLAEHMDQFVSDFAPFTSYSATHMPPPAQSFQTNVDHDLQRLYQ